MIKELKLSNFRLFDDEVTIRFRPITVLIGRNNAGKSSVIKFLLMLQQSINDTSTEFLNPEGERVKLGSFRRLKNSISKRRSLHFELEIQTSRFAFLAEQILESIVSVGESKRTDTDGVEREVKPIQQTETYQEPQANFKITANVTYSSKVKRGSQKVEARSSRGFQIKREGKIGETSLFINGLTRMGRQIKNKDDINVLFGEIMGKEGLPSEGMYSKEYLLDLMEDLYLTLYFETPKREIANIKHISPTRVSFSRVIELATPPEDSVGQNGEYSIPHLQRLMEEPDERYDILSMYLESLVDVENLEFKGPKNLGPLRHITALATNSKTKARSYLSEFGFGVSQVIPILVQGVLMNPYTQLMIEEPEAQLHPTAQLELGSYFADIWKKRDVGSIIETHSGNILLRLRRLIANGFLNPEDVSVAFFDIEEGKPVVKNLDIDSDGDMQEGLPMEFFGADIIEGLELGART